MKLRYRRNLLGKYDIVEIAAITVLGLCTLIALVAFVHAASQLAHFTVTGCSPYAAL